eukprot:TRINITY_DN562_c2_g1_i3.p2 TRINITY_DN562_c2_g1~~TRINITY_DN562_c2_g1_i3.p2  ORF type:complete len:150 (+),score=38.98 TRINITY_DN562_c2_g1_i3:767-1216(+)
MKTEQWKWALLLRLSPVPSWVNNYGLALTPVGFPAYLVSTVVGGVLMIVQNVNIGAALGSLAALIGDNVASAITATTPPEAAGNNINLGQQQDDTELTGDNALNWVRMCVTAVSALASVVITTKIRNITKHKLSGTDTAPATTAAAALS